MKLKLSLTKQIWLPLLLGLTLGIVGCNGEVKEDEPTTPPVVTPPPTPPVVTPDPVDQVGTWENKDEDGDGVLDENDDYPFDADKSAYPLIVEEEFNNNLGVATPINTSVPFRVSGAVQEQLDTDLYRFESEGERTLTVILKSNNVEFEPSITIFNSSGESLQPLPTNYIPMGIVRNTVTFFLRQSGTFYLAINDDGRDGSSDYTYKAFVFDDSDVDGLDDSIESAFGLSNIEIDSDKDSIFDANEFYVYQYDDVLDHDIDNDGIPNWLDDDSDGDTISDRIEKVYDFDRDGRASFTDEDSDGDGVSDQSEAGDGSGIYNDLDNDGFYDYIDTDDDGDFLLDKNDAFPKEDLKTAMPGETGYRTLYYLSHLYNGEPINDIHIEEETHTLIGNGIEGTGFIIFDMGQKIPPLNIPITVNTDTIFSFILPQDAKKVFFSSNDFRSNRLKINYVNSRIPIINSPKEGYYLEGSEVTLTGKNFFEDTKVLIDDKMITPIIESTSQLRFNLPTGLSSEVYVNLKTTYGKSNRRALKIGKAVAVSIAQPLVQANMPFVVSYHSPTGKRYYLDNRSQIDIVISAGHEILVLMDEDTGGNKKVLQYRMSFGDQSRLEFTPLESAKSIAWKDSNSKNAVPEYQWHQFYDDLAKLKEVQDLAQQIEISLQADSRQDSLTDKYKALENTAVTRVIKLSREGDNNAQKQLSPKSQKKNNLSLNSTCEQNDSTYKPIVCADWDGFEDNIDIYATTKWDNFADLVFDGNFGVDNDTAMFLSTQMYHLETEKLLHKHVTKHFDDFMIGPQDWGLLNLSTTQDYPQCNYSNCKIEVVTPGFTGNQPSKPTTEEAQEIIIFRTMLEQVFLPTLALVLDTELSDDKKWIGDVVTELYPTFKKAVSLSSKNSPADVMGEFIKLVIDDHLSQSGISKLTTLIALKLGAGQLLEGVVEKLVIRFAPIAIPVYGEFYAFYLILKQYLGTLNLGNTVLNTAVDMLRVPGVVIFEVKWPVVITQVLPSAINRKQVNQDVPLLIEGQGFLPVEFTFDTVYPEVEVKDTKGTADESDDSIVLERLTDDVNLSPDGTAIKFLNMSKQKVLDAKGPLRVFVEVSDAKPHKDIEYYDGIKITKISPDEIYPGWKVKVDGAGFSPTASLNVVTFQGSSGRVKAQVLSASLNRLEVLVPEKAVTGDVMLTVDKVAAENRYPVIVLNTGATVRFGDNGNLADDIFTIKFAGRDLIMDSAGQRQLDLFRQLIPGEYDVKLTADTVPDARGTYYVCFSDNVEVLSGDPFQHKELLAEKGDAVNWRVKVTSGVGKAISKCSQSEIKSNSSIRFNSPLID